MRQYLELPRAIYFICLGVFINRAGSFIVPFLTIYLSQRLGLGNLFATQAMGLFGMGAVIGALIGGHLADKLGRRVVMLLALFGGAALMLVLSTLTSGPAIMICIPILAMVSDLYRPAAQAMMADLVEPLKRPYAFTLIYVAINLGFAVGPALGGLLLEHTSFQVLFWGDAATTATYGLLVLFALRETIHLARRETKPAPAAEPGAANIDPLTAWQRITGDTNFMLLCVATLLVSLVYMQAMSTFPLYAGAHGVKPDQFGRIIALNGIMIAVGQIPLTYFLRRFDRGTVLTLAACLTALGFGLKGVSTTAAAFALCVVIWTIGEMMQVPMMGPLVSELAPPDLRARYMGVFSMCHSGANMIAAPLGGMVLTYFGGARLWQIAAVTAALAALCYWAACQRIKRSSASAPA